jgi:hypothetical protein
MFGNWRQGDMFGLIGFISTPRVRERTWIGNKREERRFEEEGKRRKGDRRREGKELKAEAEK